MPAFLNTAIPTPIFKFDDAEFSCLLVSPRARLLRNHEKRVLEGQLRQPVQCWAKKTPCRQIDVCYS